MQRARNDLRYSLYRSLHTYTQSFDYPQAFHNRYRPLLDCRRYLPNLLQSPDCNRPQMTVSGGPTPEPTTVLARPIHIPFNHTTTVGLPYSFTRHIPICPPTDTEPFDPIPIFGRLMPNPNVRSDTNLGSTITNPLHYIVSLKDKRSFMVIYGYH